MASNIDQLLIDLEVLLNENLVVRKKWKMFKKLVENYSVDQSSISNELEEFNDAYSEMLDLLVPNDPSKAQAIDVTVYNRLEDLLKQMRGLLEGLTMNNFFLRKKLLKVEEGLKEAKEKLEQNQNDMEDLKRNFNEIQFFTLVYTITTPIKDELSRSFSGPTMDLCNRHTLLGIRRNHPQTAKVSGEIFTKVMEAYQYVANKLGISTDQLIDIMLLRTKRNSSQHDFLKDYLVDCEIDNRSAKFGEILALLNIKPIAEYRPTELKTLEKVFSFFLPTYAYQT